MQHPTSDTQWNSSVRWALRVLDKINGNVWAEEHHNDENLVRKFSKTESYSESFRTHPLDWKVMSVDSEILPFCCVWKGFSLLEEVYAKVVEVVSFQLLNQESYLTSEGELMIAKHVYLEALKGRRLSGVLNSWRSPSVLRSIQT